MPKLSFVCMLCLFYLFTYIKVCFTLAADFTILWKVIHGALINRQWLTSSLQAFMRPYSCLLHSPLVDPQRFFFSIPLGILH